MAIGTWFNPVDKDLKKQLETETQDTWLSTYQDRVGALTPVIDNFSKTTRLPTLPRVNVSTGVSPAEFVFPDGTSEETKANFSQILKDRDLEKLYNDKVQYETKLSEVTELLEELGFLYEKSGGNDAILKQLETLSESYSDLVRGYNTALGKYNNYLNNPDTQIAVNEQRLKFLEADKGLMPGSISGDIYAARGGDVKNDPEGRFSTSSSDEYGALKTEIDNQRAKAYNQKYINEVSDIIDSVSHTTEYAKVANTADPERIREIIVKAKGEPLFKLMTDQEALVYNTLLAKDQAKANDYLDKLQRTSIAQRRNVAAQTKAEGRSDYGNYLSRVVNFFPSAVIGSAEYIKQGIAGILKDDGIPMNTGKSTLNPTVNRMYAEQAITEDKGKGGKFLWEASMMLGDIITTLPFSFVGGTIAKGASAASVKAAGSAAAKKLGIEAMGKEASTLTGLVLLSSEAGSQAALGVTQNGGSSKQALSIGLMTAATEFLTEYIPLKRLMKILSGSKELINFKTIRLALEQAGLEGSEELINQLVQNMLEIKISGSNSAYMQYYNKLIADGKSESEARKITNTEFFVMQPLYAAGQGAFAGFILGGGAGGIAKLPRDTKRAMAKVYNSKNADVPLPEFLIGERKIQGIIAAANVGQKGSEAQIAQAEIETLAYEQEQLGGGRPSSAKLIGTEIQPQLTEGTDVEVEDLTAFFESTKKVLSKFGIKNIKVSESLVGKDSPDSYWDRETRTIYVSPKLKTKGQLYFSIGHEIVHPAKREDIKLIDDIITEMERAGIDLESEEAAYRRTYERLEQDENGLSAEEARKKVTKDYLREEMAADYIGKILAKGEALNNLKQSNRPLLEKIADGIEKVKAVLDQADPLYNDVLKLSALVREILAQKTKKEPAKEEPTKKETPKPEAEEPEKAKTKEVYTVTEARKYIAEELYDPNMDLEPGETKQSWIEEMVEAMRDDGLIVSAKEAKAIRQTTEPVKEKKGTQEPPRAKKAEEGETRRGEVLGENEEYVIYENSDGLTTKEMRWKANFTVVNKKTGEVVETDSSGTWETAGTALYEKYIGEPPWVKKINEALAGTEVTPTKSEVATAEDEVLAAFRESIRKTGYVDESGELHQFETVEEAEDYSKQFAKRVKDSPDVAKMLSDYLLNSVQAAEDSIASIFDMTDEGSRQVISDAIYAVTQNHDAKLEIGNETAEIAFTAIYAEYSKYLDKKMSDKARSKDGAIHQIAFNKTLNLLKARFNIYDTAQKALGQFTRDELTKLITSLGVPTEVELNDIADEIQTLEVRDRAAHQAFVLNTSPEFAYFANLIRNPYYDAIPPASLSEGVVKDLRDAAKIKQALAKSRAKMKFAHKQMDEARRLEMEQFIHTYADEWGVSKWDKMKEDYFTGLLYGREKPERIIEDIFKDLGVAREFIENYIYPLKEADYNSIRDVEKVKEWATFYHTVTGTQEVISDYVNGTQFTVEKKDRDEEKDKKTKGRRSLKVLLGSSEHNGIITATVAGLPETDTKVKVAFGETKPWRVDTKIHGKDTLPEDAYVQLMAVAKSRIAYIETMPSIAMDGYTLQEWQQRVTDLENMCPSLAQDREVARKIDWLPKIWGGVYDEINAARVRNALQRKFMPVGWVPLSPLNTEFMQSDHFLSTFGDGTHFNINVMDVPMELSSEQKFVTTGLDLDKIFSGQKLKKSDYNQFGALGTFDRYLPGLYDMINFIKPLSFIEHFNKELRVRFSSPNIKEAISKNRLDRTITEDKRGENVEEILYPGTKRQGSQRMTRLEGFTSNMETWVDTMQNRPTDFDNTLRSTFGKKAYIILRRLENRIAANMILVNLGSWLTNVVVAAQAFGSFRASSVLWAAQATLGDVFNRNPNNPVLMSRFLHVRRSSYKSPPLMMTKSQQWAHTAGKGLYAFDYVGTQIVWLAAYHECTEKYNMSQEEAIRFADMWCDKIVAGRSKTDLPTMFGSRNPLIKIFTMFQIEVNNQLSALFKDIPRNAKLTPDGKVRNNAAGRAYLAGKLMMYLIAVYMYDDLFELLAGREMAFNPLNMVNHFVGDLTGEEIPNLFSKDLWNKKDGGWETYKQDTEAAVGALLKYVSENVPIVSGLTAGGRYPFENALPKWGQLFAGLWGLATEPGNLEYDTFRIKKALAGTAAYTILPFGGSAVKKMVEAIYAQRQGGVFKETSTGRVLDYALYTEPGKLIPGTAEFRAFMQAAIFGRTTTEGGQKWIEYDFKSLSPTLTKAYQALIDADVSPQAAYETLFAIGQYPDEGGGLALRRTSLGNSVLTDAQKMTAAYSLYSSNQYEQLNAAMEAGLTFKEATVVWNKYSEIDNTKVGDKEIKSTQKAIEFAAWLAKAGYTDEQKEMLGDAYQFSTFIPLESNAYDKFTAAGLSADSAYKIASELTALQPLEGADQVDDYQKYIAIDDSAYLTAAEKLQAFDGLIPDGEKGTYYKIQTFYQYDVTMSNYAAFRRAAKDKGTSQDDIYEVLMALDIPYSEKAVLWQTYQKDWKPYNNPFEQYADVYAVYDYLNALYPVKEE